MNAADGSSSRIPLWAWMFLGAAFVFLFGALLMGILDGRPEEVTTNPNEPSPLEETEVAQEVGQQRPNVTLRGTNIPHKMETPRAVAKSLYDGKDIKISEPEERAEKTNKEQGQQAPNTQANPAPPGQADKGERVANKQKNPVRDMMPMGRVTENPSENTRPRGVHEALPSFVFNDKRWVPTGKYASKEQLDLRHTGHKLNGRDLYALAHSDNPSALFLESKHNPSKLAIYR